MYPTTESFSLPKLISYQITQKYPRPFSNKFKLDQQNLLLVPRISQNIVEDTCSGRPSPICSMDEN